MATYVKWGMGQDYRADSLTGEAEADLRGRFILGTPEECAEQLDELRVATGMTHFAIKPQWPGLAHEEAVTQVTRFGDEVIPLLQK
jgi:alkanesulfonate monooxygenase SsuD/methylene tetrahydromethanopterin reductase-like flavin-dependent oxidoreductase (luciferase family)